MIADVKDIIVVIVSSGAFFSFIQFMLTRYDNKKNIEKKIDKVSSEVSVLSERLEEHKATLARTHILRFADELRAGTHSREYFEQQLQDIDTYNRYCESHPDFANGLTRMASKFIKDEYMRLYLSNDTD